MAVSCLRCGKDGLEAVHPCKPCKEYTYGYKVGQNALVKAIRKMIVDEQIKYTSKLDEILNKMERD